jgi:hypothetical protein
MLRENDDFLTARLTFQVAVEVNNRKVLELRAAADTLTNRIAQQAQ